MVRRGGYDSGSEGKPHPVAPDLVRGVLLRLPPFMLQEFPIRPVLSSPARPQTDPRQVLWCPWRFEAEGSRAVLLSFFHALVRGCRAETPGTAHSIWRETGSFSRCLATADTERHFTPRNALLATAVISSTFESCPAAFSNRF